ncbi:MAG: hypothetical protein KDK54_19715 [Leptospiraceae bacterium]|nr:hypothetical protein [Leptospiraceae bacterium]
MKSENKNLEISDNDIILDEETKDRIIEKKTERIKKRELTNEDIQSQIETKQLKSKLESVKIGTIGEAFADQKKRIIKLLRASWFGTIVFVLILPVMLSVVHAWSIGSMASRFGSDFTKSFVIGIFFAGLFESLMIGQVLAFNHKGARFTSYSAMMVLALITGLEIYKRGFEALELADILRFVGGTFLIPIIKSFIIQIREKAEGKNKRPFDRLPEETQRIIKNDLLEVKRLLEKYENSPSTTKRIMNSKGVTIEKKEKDFKIERQNFREYSNSKRIEQDSLKKLLVDYKIFTNRCWKELPTKRKVKVDGLEGTLENQENQAEKTTQENEIVPEKNNSVKENFISRNQKKKNKKR